MSIAKGARKPVNLGLNKNVVSEARQLTTNPSGTVEKLLTDFIMREQARRADRERQIDQTIDLAIELYETYGIVGNEFSPV